jgi:CheY-like chemotaxis protein
MPASPTAPDPHALSGLQVLYVDPSSFEREVYSILLGLYGAGVVTAADGPAAIERLAGDEVDVLVSELGIPSPDGRDLIECVRSLPLERWRTLPAIAATAWADERNLEGAIAKGFDAVLTKPFEPDALVSTILELRFLIAETRRLRERSIEQQVEQRALRQVLQARRFALLRQRARFQLRDEDPEVRATAWRELVRLAACEAAERHFGGEVDELLTETVTRIDDDHERWTVAAARGDDLLRIEVVLGPGGSANVRH